MAVPFFLFAASLAVGLVASTGCWLRFGLKAAETRPWLLMTGCVFLSYLCGLGFVCCDPYFDDNEAREFISWQFRWAWAWMWAGLFQFAIIPCGFGLYAAWHRFYGKQKTATV